MLPGCWFCAAGLATGTFFEILDKGNRTSALVDAATARAAGLATPNRSVITKLCAVLPVTSQAHAGMQVHVRVDASWQTGKDEDKEPFYVAGVLVSIDADSTGQMKTPAGSTMLITSLAREANQGTPRGNDFVCHWQGGENRPDPFKAADKVLLQEIEQPEDDDDDDEDNYGVIDDEEDYGVGDNAPPLPGPRVVHTET